MAKRERAALTVARIDKATCPTGRRQFLLWDSEQPGLIVRIYSTGKKTYLYRYRPSGGGRGENPRYYTIGDVEAVSLKDAREAARIAAGKVAKGEDPAAERREARTRERARLGTAIDDYEKSLEQRGASSSHVKESTSLLRRELATPFGADRDLSTLTRKDLVDRINAVRDGGRPGAAKQLRTRASVFLNWATSVGLCEANPLGGYRMPRRTRSERLEQTGRALADHEIPVVWRAAEAQGWPFGPYLQTLLLTGQRRTETALMQWAHVDLDAGEWTIPAAITKTGRTHRVPLPPELVAILEKLPRINRCPLVFPGRKGATLAGWSKRLPRIHKLTEAEGVEHWTLHDLRRTARSGLSALGVDSVTAELMLNHALSDALAKVYDRHDAWPRRVDAAARWARHVLGLVERPPSNVVRFRA